MSDIYVPTLSFCITCKNRFHQIAKTLPQNLEDNRMFKNRIEFILVDFGSTDGLREWIKENFMKEIEEGYLKYFYTEELHSWHASIAKNTAHLLAKNEILVNLDCDNYTGYNGGRFVIRQFVKHGEKIVLHQYGGDIYDGSYGRIGLMHSFFLQVRGYDESFAPMAYQDTDLINRLCLLGLTYKLIPNTKYNTAIRNTKEEGILYVESKENWLDMMKRNQLKSEKNLLSRNFIVNDKQWGIRKHIVNINDEVVIVDS